MVSGSVGDLVLGPGKDGLTVLPEGIKASELSAAQRAILLDLIGKYVNVMHDDAAESKLEAIRTGLADTSNPTYFSWRGPVTAGSAAYFRVQGPNLFIEFAPQSMGATPTTTSTPCTANSATTTERSFPDEIPGPSIETAGKTLAPFVPWTGETVPSPVPRAVDRPLPSRPCG